MITHKHIFSRLLAVGLTVIMIAVPALGGTVIGQLLSTYERVQAQGQQEEQTPAAIRVAAGGGNATAPWKSPSQRLTSELVIIFGASGFERRW